MTVFDFIERFILFVVPGFVGYSLFCYLTGKRQSSELFSIAYIFIISILSFLGGNMMLFLINYLPNTGFEMVNVSQILSGDKQSLSTAGLASAIFASVIIGFLAFGIYEHDLLFRFANIIKLTNRIDNDDVWVDLFDEEPWVVVRDHVTGNTYFGKVVSFSDSEDNKLREILLEDVDVYSICDGDYKMKQVYFSRNPSEFSIEIDYYEKEKKENVELGKEVTCAGKA